MLVEFIHMQKKRDRDRQTDRQMNMYRMYGVEWIKFTRHLNVRIVCNLNQLSNANIAYTVANHLHKLKI